jgi:hypothetical protein
LSDLGGKEFFDETMGLESIPIPNQSLLLLPDTNDNIQSRRASPVDTIRKNAGMEHSSQAHLQICIPKSHHIDQSQLSLYEK